MSLSSWLPRTFSRSHALRGQRRSLASRCKKARLFLEYLEGRALLSNYSAATVSALIADISLSNKAGGANTITLTAPTSSPYQLTSPLPSIAATDNLTIVGDGDNTIEAIRGSSTIGVAPGATLTLDNLQVRGFTNTGGRGGAIDNQGALTLSAVTVSSNKSGFALYSGTQAQGGAIWSNGSLTLENGTLFSRNYAEGGEGEAPAGTEPPIHNPYSTASPPGNAYGGAVYIAGGTANISDTTFSGNFAEGGFNDDGAGGAGFGGALYIAGGQVVVTATNINGNQANLSPGGVSFGAGVFVAGGTVTVANCTLGSNTTSSSGTGYGGALFVAGGTVALTNDTVESNTATYGGGLCVAAGRVTLTNCTVQSNLATYGGGLYVGTVILPNASDTGAYPVSGATVYLDPYTFANTINNTDSSGTNGSTANIDGTYFLT